MFRVVLADDQALLRAGFRVLLDSEDDMEVVGEAATGAEAVALAQELQPDVILMDIRMPELDGIEATKQITAASDLANVRVVVLTTYEVDEYVFEALRAGASGFLLKDIEPADLVKAVRVAAMGDSLLAPSVTRRLIEEFTGLEGSQRMSRERLAVLTDREREVMALAARGLNNDEIAAKLEVSPQG